MAFYGSTFVFNGVPCEDFDLMLYDVGSTSQENGEFASVVSIVEEELATKWKPIFYGVKFEKKLEFEMVFGVNQKRLDEGSFLDRYELEAVASWLTGLDGYRWLSIAQEDMRHVRYKCYVSSLEIVGYGMIPWALRASITCDSPYAYMSESEFVYTISGSKSINFLNESSYNGYYYPKLEIATQGGGSFSIENETDNKRVFELKDIPASITKINIDNENGVIKNDADLNLYDCFNFNFLRLKRGYNKLNVTGNGTLKIICEFPVNVGG